ncbi:MAG: hypothetical protein IT535_07385 [Bauldia sp.]|nr:hypothetical protein [Bauldia sp.]
MSINSAFYRSDGARNEPGVESPWREWVSAAATLNFANDDPLIDWLEEFGSLKGHKRDDAEQGYDPRTDFRRFVEERSREFEARVIGHLEGNAKVLHIAKDARSAQDATAVLSTWEAMRAGVEVIAHGVLWHAQTKTYGIPDLLVRSDVLNRFFPSDLSSEESAQPAPDLPLPSAHYRVVEIKFTTLDLLKDGHASSAHLKYMIQVWLYTQALGAMQGYPPSAGYILGRRWKTANERGTSALERLARVDFAPRSGKSKVDLEKGAAGACQWIRRMRSNGASWDLLPQPSVLELWPNLRSTDDQPWHQAKRRFAADLEDLTLLPRVGPKQRAEAIATGLSRWSDPNCSAARLGITGDKAPLIVDAVIKANQSDKTGPFVFPSRLTANELLWRDPVVPEFFVDFETVSDLDDDFSKFPEVNGQPLIFMIGCGHLAGPSDAPVWKFAQFTTDRLSLDEESRIVDEWLAHMAAICRERSSAPAASRIFHWSPAETSNLSDAYNAAAVRQGRTDWSDLPWCDLLNRVVREQPVTVRGAFGFGLKAIAKAMQGGGLIKTLWSDGPADGLGAMVGAWHCHREAIRQSKRMMEIDLMQAIARYNEVDCKVMAEALGYLRAQH